MRSHPAPLCLALLIASCGDDGGGATGTGAGSTGPATPTSGESTPTDDTPTTNTPTADPDTSAGSDPTASSTTSPDATTADSTTTAGTGESTGDTTLADTTDTTSTTATAGDTELKPDCDGRFECTGETLWSKLVGNEPGPASSESISTVVVAPDGEITIAGTLNGSIDFGPGGVLSGPAGAFVARLTPDGEYVWARGMTADDSVFIQGIGRDDAGNVTIVGSASDDLLIDAMVIPGDSLGHDVLIASYGPQGDLRYAGLHGSDSAQDVARAVAVAPDGSVAVVGEFRQSIDFGGNQLNANGGQYPDMFAVVLDADGGHRWSRRFGDDGTQFGVGAAFLGPDVVVAASNYKTIDFGGQPLPTTGLGALALARLGGADGQPAWAAQFEDAGKKDLGSASLAADADALWFVTYDSSAEPHSVDFGDGPVAGYFYLVSLDAAGATRWARGFDDLRGAFGIVRDGGDSITIAGAAEGTIDLGRGPVMTKGGYDAMVAKYAAADGSYRWGRIVGDYDQKMQIQDADDLGVDAAGHLYVGGQFAGSMHWGDQELVSGHGMGGLDGFLVKLLP